MGAETVWHLKKVHIQVEVLKHETFKCATIRHAEVLTGETMKLNAQIWASKFENVDPFELSKAIQDVCSQDEKWTSLSHLPFFQFI